MAAWQAQRGPGSPPPCPPLAMVGSGQAIVDGRQPARTYRGLVDAELTRLPGAIVSAQREFPSTTETVVRVQVTNVTTVTLHAPVNDAMVALRSYHPAFGDFHDSGLLAARPFDSPLAPGETARLEFPLPGVVRGVLVLVEFRPANGAGRWDMLQAAFADSAALPAIPTTPPTAAPSNTSTPPPTDTPTTLPKSTPPPTATTLPSPPTTPSPSPVFLPDVGA